MSTIKEVEKPLTEEDKIKIKETSVFIDNTNRESMEMIKKAILLAINRLQQYQPVDEDKDAYYLKEEDVLEAIELSYKIQVAQYEALQKIAIAGITGIPIEDNKQTINGLHKITDEELARATAMFLPASPTGTPTGTPNANNILLEPADPHNSLITVPHNPNGTITLPRGGMYRPKKHKKSRKHPK